MNERPHRDGSEHSGHRNERDGSRPQRGGGFGRGEGARDDRRPRRDDDRRDGGFRGRQDDGGGRPRRDGSDARRPRQNSDDRRPRRDSADDRRPRTESGDRDARRPRRDYDNRGGDARGPRTESTGRPERGRGGTRGGGRSDRGGRDREYTEAERLQHQLRPVRAEHADPMIPDDVQAQDLHPAARKELKTLQVDLQDRVARHLAMVALLIDDDPELAHQHALSASRRAGRIPVTRETLAITAYRTGDFALALRELRTHRRISGRADHVALLVDCERGLGRPEKAIETGLAVDPASLDTEQRVYLAIAMSGARLDLGQIQQALFELEIPELNPRKAFSWSPELFGAYAAVLEDLGRNAEAGTWEQHARRAAGALQELVGGRDELEVFEVQESHVEPEPDPASEPDAAPEPEPEPEGREEG